MITIIISNSWGFLCTSVSKESACNAGDLGSIPGSGRFPGEGNSNPLQVFLPGKSHGQRSLVGYKSMGCQRVEHDLRTKQQMGMCKLLSRFQNKVVTLDFTFLYLFNHCKRDRPA